MVHSVTLNSWGQGGTVGKQVSTIFLAVFAEVAYQYLFPAAVTERESTVVQRETKLDL